MPFGQDPVIFDLLEQQAQMAVQAAQQFAALTQDFRKAEQTAQKIKALEHSGDELTHTLAAKTDAKFITPFDKEDIHALSHALDELTDLIEAASARLVIYRIAQPRPDFASLADLVRQSYEAVAQAMTGLRHLRDHQEMDATLTRIHALENRMDDGYRQALGTLFNAEDADPIQVLKWKELYDRVELATDQCEDVADMLENILVKYA
jgi:predicted phosphate transport protein (TIGR00153 family)